MCAFQSQEWPVFPFDNHFVAIFYNELRLSPFKSAITLLLHFEHLITVVIVRNHRKLPLMDGPRSRMKLIPTTQVSLLWQQSFSKPIFCSRSFANIVERNVRTECIKFTSPRSASIALRRCGVLCSWLELQIVDLLSVTINIILASLGRCRWWLIVHTSVLQTNEDDFYGHRRRLFLPFN